jgi:hypothetical protein
MSWASLDRSGSHTRSIALGVPTRAMQRSRGMATKPVPGVALLPYHAIGPKRKRVPKRDVSRLGAQSPSHDRFGRAWITKVRKNRMSLKSDGGTPRWCVGASAGRRVRARERRSVGAFPRPPKGKQEHIQAAERNEKEVKGRIGGASPIQQTATAPPQAANLTLFMRFFEEKRRRRVYTDRT